MAETAFDLEAASQGRDSIAQTAKAGARRGSTVKPMTVVRQVDSQRMIVPAQSHLHSSSPRVLDRIGKTFTGDEVGRSLDVVRETATQKTVISRDFHRNRQPVGPRVDCLDQATVGEDARMNPLRELAHVVEQAGGI